MEKSLGRADARRAPEGRSGVFLLMCPSYPCARQQVFDWPAVGAPRAESSGTGAPFLHQVGQGCWLCAHCGRKVPVSNMATASSTAVQSKG